MPDATRGLAKTIAAFACSAALAALAAVGVVNVFANAWGVSIAALIGAAVTLMTVVTFDQSLKLGFVANVKRALPAVSFSNGRMYIIK